MKTKRKLRAHLPSRRPRPLSRAWKPSGAKPGDATEREIKLEVPADRMEKLMQAMAASQARDVRLEAIYFDTADGALRRAKLSLRVRREGKLWVQTLKAPGAGAFERLEDEVNRDEVTSAEERPDVRPELHRGTAARALKAALDDAGDQARLIPYFEVSVRRALHQVREGISTIEVALDQGEIRAAGRRLPVRELELELIKGTASDLLRLARRWRARHGLWLATASKGERGARLAAGELHAQARGAMPLAMASNVRLGAFTAAVLSNCLEQVLANAGEVAGGSRDDDQVHQLRVGLRRLRTALRELPLLEGDRAAMEPALIQVFRVLGEQRDRSHVLRKIQPLVEAAGGPGLRVPPGFNADCDLGAAVRQHDFQDTLFALLQRIEELRRDDRGKPRKTLREHLQRLHKQVLKDGARFTKLPEDRQHGVRKRLKRLRYLVEFAAPLYAGRRVATYLAMLKPAQDALGEYNDELMARGLYEELVGSDPGARFGVDWLGARQAGQAKACRKALRRLERADAFWKRKPK